MASPGGAGGGEHSIHMPAAAMDASGDDGSQQSASEKRLNGFVRFVAFGEWAGNAFGAMAFLWATVVVLGGFCSSLNREDFWFATIMIFVETFRLFSRNYKLDNQSLFGTTSAVSWISSFARILGRPQEGDEVVLIMLSCINLTYMFPAISQVMLVIVVSKLLVLWAPQLTSQPRCRQCLLWALLIAFLICYAYGLTTVVIRLSRDHPSASSEYRIAVAREIICRPVQAAAVLLLILKPAGIVSLVSKPCGRKLVCSAKVILALWLAYELLYFTLPLLLVPDFHYIDSFWLLSMTVVLSLGSLQKHSPANQSLLGRWVDVIMHILLLSVSVIPFTPSFFFLLGPDPSPPVVAGLSFITMLAVLLIGNLQIPAAAVQVLLSSLRFRGLLAHRDYHPLPQGGSPNMVPAISVFYVLAACQGALYIMACILGSFSFLPCRSLVSRLCGQRRGAKAVDLYYQRAYAACMENGFLLAQNRLSLASFAIESLRSTSGDTRLAGLVVLDSLLQDSSDSSEKLVSAISSSQNGALISMLGWTFEQDRDMRLFSARVTAKLADRLRISDTPGILKSVSSLLDAKNQPQPASSQPPTTGDGEGTSDGCCSSCIRLRCWQWAKEKWSFPEEAPSSSHRDLLPVLGMVILEKLARDPDNCAEIAISNNLIWKVIGLMSYTTDNEHSEQSEVTCSQLNFVRRLAITEDKIGATLRQELLNNPFLLSILASILEDTHSNPQLWKPAMEIIAKLALDKEAGEQIGGTGLIISKLMHAFLGRYGPANMDDVDDHQSLPMVAGEALANLAMWGPANCSAILEEPGYEVINDLKEMLSEDEYRYVAANLLQNLCAHSRNKLMSHPDATEDLSSALTIVMEYIMAAEGKELESLIRLVSQIGDVIREVFVDVLEAQTNNGVGLVQKLVSTLNSNKKPNPEYPRMRRVIVEIMITILESCHHTVEKMMEEGVMEESLEALARIERTPSKVEKYMVFCGNIGVVPESAPSLSILVATAKLLIINSAHPTPGVRPGNNA